MNLKFVNPGFDFFLGSNEFKKGDIILIGRKHQMIVVKKYTDPFWKKLLRFLGFNLPDKRGYYKLKAFIK